MTTVRTAAAAISRMPARVQDAVSRCLADGGTWRDVASLCAAEGYPNVNAQNVTNYRKGAHKDWLARQERLVAARDRYAWKVDLLKKYTEEGGPAEAGLAAAMDMLEGALDGLDVSDIQTMIADKPGKDAGYYQTHDVPSPGNGGHPPGKPRSRRGGSGPARKRPNPAMASRKNKLPPLKMP